MEEGRVLAFQTLFQHLSHLSVTPPEGNRHHQRLVALLLPSRSERNGRARRSNSRHGAHRRTRTLWNGAAECSVQPPESTKTKAK